MITAVVDTNVLASGFLGSAKATNTPGRVLRRWYANDFQLILSEHILVELERTFATAYFAARIAPADRMASILLLRRRARVVDITAPVSGVATHPEDDVILATAVSADADYLVTGDTKLQQLGSYQGSAIVSPRAFLDLLSIACDTPHEEMSDR
jgi:putative PIN family toxin of toxin-antitoxin system